VLKASVRAASWAVDARRSGRRVQNFAAVVDDEIVKACSANDVFIWTFNPVTAFGLKLKNSDVIKAHRAFAALVSFGKVAIGIFKPLIAVDRLLIAVE